MIDESWRPSDQGNASVTLDGMRDTSMEMRAREKARRAQAAADDPLRRDAVIFVQRCTLLVIGAIMGVLTVGVFGG